MEGAFVSSAGTGVGSFTNARYDTLCTTRARGARAASSSSAPLVMMAKGRMRMPGQGPPPPSAPQLPADGTPVFAIFARTQRAKIWYPIGMVGGDNKAKTLLSGMKTEWGRRLYRGALDKGIAQIVFGPDSARFLNEAAKQFPQIKKYKNELEFGYKVLSTEIKDWPTTVVTREQALPFFEWVKYKLGMRTLTK